MKRKNTEIIIKKVFVYLNIFFGKDGVCFSLKAS